jgi:hypothetical protein
MSTRRGIQSLSLLKAANSVLFASRLEKTLASKTGACAGPGPVNPFFFFFLQKVQSTHQSQKQIT